MLVRYKKYNVLIVTCTCIIIFIRHYLDSVFRSALLNAGYKVSLSPFARNSIRTDAPSHVLWVKSFLLFEPRHKKTNNLQMGKQRHRSACSNGTADQTFCFLYTNEPVREKTNNLGFDQVHHKPGCTVTEKR